MNRYTGPLLTRPLAEALLGARAAGHASLHASFDLGRSESEASIAGDAWFLLGQSYPWPDALKVWEVQTPFSGPLPGRRRPHKGRRLGAAWARIRTSALQHAAPPMPLQVDDQGVLRRSD